MKSILVFCAGNARARSNYYASVVEGIAPETVFQAFASEQHQSLREIQARAGGFFAWGLGTTKRATFFWDQLQVGDVILGFYEFNYRVVAQLVGKEENLALAEKLWKTGDWPRMLFMTRPNPVVIKAADTSPPLCSTYRGTTRISDIRTAKIASEYGSIRAFIYEKFGVALAEFESHSP